MITGPARGKRLDVLLLCDDRPGNASTILDHIDAFGRFSRHRVKTFNPRGMRKSAALSLDEFDAVVLHYSLAVIYDSYLSRDFREKLRRYSGLKVQFLQDEYRWVDRLTATLRELGVGVLFTVLAEPEAARMYDTRLPGVRRVQTLTGYVPATLEHAPLPPLRGRPMDVVYRGRDLPFWLGRLSQEKTLIGRGFAERAARYGLRCDIAWREADRIYGDRWTRFVASARATLGTESGASITDFDGSVEQAVHAYVAEHPGAGFDEVHGAVLAPYEGNLVVKGVSPRVFEAAGLGTGLIMFPGDYSGVVAPGEHYVVLDKDFGNMDDVVEKLKDLSYMEALTRRAHDHVVRSGRWSYARFIAEFDDVIDQEASPRRRTSLAPRYRAARLERALRVPLPHVRVAGWALELGRRIGRRRDLAGRAT